MLFRRFQIALRRAVAKWRAHRTGRINLASVPPCYWVAAGLTSASVVIDCGTGPDADFSQAIIAKFGSLCHGLEPTRKHHESLDRIAAKSGGRFDYVARALAVMGPRLTFHESMSNVSGSILEDHVNVRRDLIVHYEVDTVTIDDLFALFGLERIHLLKLDIEGAEYALLEHTNRDTLERIDQLVVEFHDHCVPQLSPRDTRRIIRRLERAGFTSYSVDAINYLFFRPTSPS